MLSHHRFCLLFSTSYIIHDLKPTRRCSHPAGTASSPLRVLRASKLDGSPGLLRWRCCHGGGFPLQYARACFMTHSFLTLGFISYDDVYITNGVYIFIRKILWSCTVVFLRMSVSFTMYLVRDDLINKWNHYTPMNSYLRINAYDPQPWIVIQELMYPIVTAYSYFAIILIAIVLLGHVISIWCSIIMLRQHACIVLHRLPKNLHLRCTMRHLSSYILYEGHYIQ